MQDKFCSGKEGEENAYEEGREEEQVEVFKDLVSHVISALH